MYKRQCVGWVEDVEQFWVPRRLHVLFRVLFAPLAAPEEEAFGRRCKFAWVPFLHGNLTLLGARIIPAFHVRVALFAQAIDGFGEWAILDEVSIPIIAVLRSTYL